MNEAAADLIASFEADADVIQKAETDLRRRMTAEIEALTRSRAFAFRRTRLIKVLVAAAAAAEEEKELAAAQRGAVTSELGWDGGSDANRRVLDELAPVGRAIWQSTCSEAPSVTDSTLASNVADALKKFEAWFEATHGKSFYALFDQYVAEVPVVDF